MSILIFLKPYLILLVFYFVEWETEVDRKILKMECA